jgi:hypothetical protein
VEGLRLVDKVFFQHSAAAEHIVLFLQGLSILHLRQLSPQVFYHQFANLIVRKVLTSEVGQLGHSSLASHVAAGDEAELDGHVASGVEVEDDALVDLADVHNQNAIFGLFLGVSQQPLENRTIRRHIPDSVGLNYQIFKLLLDWHTEWSEFE